MLISVIKLIVIVIFAVCVSTVTANVEHTIDPNEPDQVPWLVFIASYKNQKLSYFYNWGTLIHDQVVMVTNDSYTREETDLMVFADCVVSYNRPMNCLSSKVVKMVRNDDSFILLILQDPFKIREPEKNIIKLSNGDDYHGDDCYIPYVHFVHVFEHEHLSSAYIKALYKAEMSRGTVLVFRDENGAPIDQYGSSYHPVLKVMIPEEGFPLVCRGSYNSYLMVKMFSSSGAEFNRMSDYFNSPTDLLITRNVKHQVDIIIQKNGLKRNCLRNLACTGDSEWA